MEANGVIYAFALNHSDSSFTRVATIASGFNGVMALDFDRELHNLWAVCDEFRNVSGPPGCNGRSAVLGIDTNPGSPSKGRFVSTHVFERPAGMPSSPACLTTNPQCGINNEGFAIAPQAECVDNLKPVFWADDNGTDGHAIRAGTITCGSLDKYVVIAKGKYLANTTCVECHTQRVAGDPYRLDRSKLFGGGEEFAGPWGVLHSKNISSDVETGIGSWTEAEIKRAITEGISKDGTKLLVMPWEIFRGLADEDVSAIAAYLKTVPLVKNTVPQAKLASAEAVAGFIGSIPPLKAAVPASLYSNPRAVFHDFFFGGDPGSSKPAPAGFLAPEGKDSATRGLYLAQNLLGCTFCHSPNLAGGTPPFFGANITPDRQTGIGNWSREDVVKALREGLRPDGRRLSPVMPAGDLAFGRLTDDDVYNLIAFMQSVPAVRRAPGEPNAAFGPPPSAPAPGGPAGATQPAALPKTGEENAQTMIILAAGLGILLLAGGAVMRRKRKDSKV